VPLRPIWLNSTFAGSPYASTKRNRSRPLADRQLAQGLPMKRSQNKRSAVKLFPLSVAIALALTLFLAPMPQVFAAQECDMFGVSPIEARNCHGCCAQMKCCSVPNQDENSQPSFAWIEESVRFPVAIISSPSLLNFQFFSMRFRAIERMIASPGRHLSLPYFLHWLASASV
jgi:hypothetical protein